MTDGERERARWTESGQAPGLRATCSARATSGQPGRTMS